MSEEQSTTVPVEKVEAARVRLADWLTAQVPDNPELGTTPEELADWQVRAEEEFLLFIPPGYANRLFLVDEHGITGYSPSQTNLDEAIAAARARTELT